MRKVAARTWSASTCRLAVRAADGGASAARSAKEATMPREDVDLVVAAHALEDGRHPLQAHAGVDGPLGQRRPVAALVLVELHEHQVPDLHPAVAAALVVGTAVGAPARAGAAPVPVDLAVVPARPGGPGLPPVVGEAGDAFRRHADLAPEPLGLGVVRVDARPQAVAVEPEVLGEQLPGEADRPLLEVLADRPVAEHLEEGVVGVVADRGDVVGAQALAAEALLARHQERRWAGSPRR